MTGSRSKVVPLKPLAAAGKGVDKDGVGMEMLPLSLQRLLERCRPLLLELLQSLFDQTDDALFELADRAASNAEQNMFFESLREVRIKRRGIEQAMLRELLEGCRALAQGAAAAAPATPLDGASAATLSLIENDELEEIVAVESMVSRAEKNFAEPLALLTARLATLLPGRDVTLGNNPLGPAALCDSFAAAGRSLELDIRARLVLFKLFDRHVIKGLDSMYDAANRLLAEEGVLPDLRQGRDSAARVPVSEGDAERVFSDLQRMLDAVRQPEPVTAVAPRAGLLAPGLAPLLPRDALMQLLSRVQQHQMNALARQQPAVLRGVPPQQFDILQALNGLLQQQLPDRAVSLGQVDDDAINLVSMLFQFIVEDRNLAAPIKGLIARLQIPILKLAMQDRSFFGRNGHPARKLLNELANASLGWSPVGEVERDPFYRNLEKLVHRIIDQFDGDAAVFQRELEDFLAFTELERRRASLVAQRTVDAEDGRARSELARVQVQQLLAEKTAGRELPEVVVKLLESGWSNVLFLICLKEGTDSDSWQHALQTLDDLLESVSPVQSLADRAQLLRTLPTLLNSLRNGLSKTGFNAFELNQLFAELEQIHLQRLQHEETAELVSPVVEDEQLSNGSSETAVEPAQPLEEAPAVLSGELAALDAELALSLGEEAATAVAGGEVAGATAIASPVVVDVAPAGVVAADALQAVSEEPAPIPSMPVAEVPSQREQAAAQARQRMDQLQVGGWVEFHREAVVRCRLAAVIRATGKYIFVNRAGVKVAESTRDELAEAYRRGELRVLEEGRLFDRALESVIGNLREMRSRGS